MDASHTQGYDQSHDAPSGTWDSVSSAPDRRHSTQTFTVARVEFRPPTTRTCDLTPRDEDIPTLSVVCTPDKQQLTTSKYLNRA